MILLILMMTKEFCWNIKNFELLLLKDVTEELVAYRLRYKK